MHLSAEKEDGSFSPDALQMRENRYNRGKRVSGGLPMLATKQYCGVSNGSACTSSSYSHSHVLSAMHLPDDRIESAIRISWGGDVMAEQLHRELNKMLFIAKSIY